MSVVKTVLEQAIQQRECLKASHQRNLDSYRLTLQNVEKNIENIDMEIEALRAAIPE
jgi:hypothetical protein